MTNHLKLAPQRGLVTLALLVTVLIALANPALGADFNASDETTLNTAITGVNSAGAGTHTINITADINLSASTTALNNTTATEVIINGNGFTVDGQGINGVLPFEIEADTTVAINDLTISGGKRPDGGGIRNEGTLTLTNSIVSGNSADYNGGGIYNYYLATMTLINSTVSGNSAGYSSGGILNTAGTLMLTNSTVTGNRARFGGGIYNSSASDSGTVTLTNSTVSGNSATDYGGGILNTADSNGSATVTLTNSTVSGNSGGGIFNRKTVMLTNSIIADQTSGADCLNDTGGIINSNGYNLDSDGSCSLSGTGDIANGTADLQPLAITAPGTTATHALGPNSDALDAIPVVNDSCHDTGISTDQRGVARPLGTHCDIGAYESAGFGSLTLVKAADPEDGTDFAFTSDIPGGGSFSLDVDSDNTLANSITFADIPTGSYTITEILPSDWVLDSAHCEGGADSGNLSGESLSLMVGIGELITCTFNNRYEDGDSIVADEEDNVPGYNGSAQGDGNGDSIADRLQATVSSVQDSGSGCWWTIETDGVQHSNVALEAIPAGVPPGVYPCNFASFEVALAQAQSQLQLTLYFSPRNPTIQGVLKFNHLSEQWDMIGTVDHSGDKTIVRYSLSDGGPYDDDRAEDGRIQDPVGAVSPPSVIPTLSPVGLGALIVAWILLLIGVRRRQGRGVGRQ